MKLLTFALILITVSPSVRADEIEAEYVVSGGGFTSTYWSLPENWVPEGVPDNSGGDTYNVTLNRSRLVVDGHYTIGNLAMTPENGFVEINSLIAEGQGGTASLRVNGTTTIAPALLLSIPSGSSPNRMGTTRIDLGTLANFDPATGTLSGFRLSVVGGGVETVVSFNGADIRTSKVDLLLRGTARITDEMGEDALRNLSLSTAEFSILGKALELPVPFENRARLTVQTVFTGSSSVGGEPTIEGEAAVVDISGGLLNFDPVNKTLSGGSFDIHDLSTLKFPGADVVRLDAGLRLLQRARFIDSEPGEADALRNLAEVSPSGSLTTSNRDILIADDLFVEGSIFLLGDARKNQDPDPVTLSVTGNLSNRGSIVLHSNTNALAGLVVEGDFSNFDSASRTLSGGAIYLRSSLGSSSVSDPVTFQFPGADIVVNASDLAVVGNVNLSTPDGLPGLHALRNLATNAEEGILTLAPEGPVGFVTIGPFENLGRLNVGADVETSKFSVLPGATLTNRGTLALVRDSTVITAGAGRLESLPGATLSGSGTFSGNTDNGGLIAPEVVSLSGPRPGTLNFNGNLTLLATSDVVSEIAYLTSFDQVVVTGAATLGGRLTTNFIFPGSYSGCLYPQPEDRFDVFTASGGFTGSFANASDGDRIATTDGKGTFLVTYSETAITLTDFLPNPDLESYSDWAVRNGLVANNNATDDDPNHDSIPNLIAYALDIPPLGATAGSGIVFSDGAISFSVDPCACGFVIGSEISEGGTGFNWLSGPDPIAIGNPEDRRYVVPFEADGITRFARLRFTLQP